MTFGVSVLDLGIVDADQGFSKALCNSINLAQYAEKSGLSRIWYAEHHGTPGIASSAPEILVASALSQTAKINVGSGGIMLPNYSPYKIAELFRTLEALAPNRVDLGIGRGPGADTLTTVALRGSASFRNSNDYAAQVEELLGFGHSCLSKDHPFHSVVANPSDVPLPRVWILGASIASAALAARLGLRYAYASHINSRDAIQALRFYRLHFKASIYLDQPYSMMVASVICGTNDQEADHLATSMDVSLLQQKSGKIPPLEAPEQAVLWLRSHNPTGRALPHRDMHIVGSPSTVRSRLEELMESSAADELMIVTTIYGSTQRIRSLDLVLSELTSKSESMKNFIHGS